MAGRATRVVAPWATSTYDYSTMTGQLVSSSRDGQRLDWRYDGMLAVHESASGVVSGRISRRYDEDFRVVELAVNDAGISYAYDDDGLLTAAGPVVMVRSATTGQLQTATTGPVTTAYTYDTYGAPASIETRVGSTVVFREALTWDDIGRITAKDVAVQGTSNRWEYAYDSASRLSQVRRDGQSVGVWAYDGNGNRVSADGVAATFDAQDRHLTSGAVTFGHDAFGNRTRKTEGTQVTHYVYDGVGGLLSATLPDSTRLEYVIDSRGRRVGKKRNGSLEKGWLYDGQLRIVAELDGSGAVASRFIYGTLSHSPDVMVRGGVAYRYVHDVLGSVRLVINTATSQVAQRLDYDSWGAITSDSSPGFQPFGFAGGLYDLDTGLTRFGARDYDAVEGRWTSKDPIGFSGSSGNLYAYVDSRPSSAFDSSGLEIEAGSSCSSATDPKLKELIKKMNKNIKKGKLSSRCSKILDDFNISNIAVSSFPYTIECSDKDILPDCGGGSEGSPECGQANSESRCATVNTNPKRKGCERKSIAKRVLHEIGHLGRQRNQHVRGDDESWSELESCAGEVVGE
ncbi:MAG: RHS repeat-associated core domain-containing protein [Myxococcales bacterium]|nr:RHS repeat-associated core domain-containing protein [Myxococcales bacterium]